MHVHIDFETRSLADIKKGSWNYSVDPSTKIICCAYGIDKEEPRLIIGRGFPVVSQYDTDWSELRELATNPEVKFYAHNATFEMHIWENIMVPQYDMPPIPITRWYCTMAMCYMYNLPGSLDKAGQVLQLTDQKDTRGKYLIGKLSCPRKPSKNNPSIWNDDPDLFVEMYEYCVKDVLCERGITERLPDLIPFEREIWVMDKTMNRRGMQLDTELIEGAVEIAAEHKGRMVPLFKVVTEGKVKAPTQVQKTIDWCAEQGVELKALDKAAVEKALKGELPDNVRRALEIRQELSKSSVSKYTAAKKLADDHGVLRDYLVYGRAITMRWGGSGFQPQNLPSRGIYKQMEVLAHLIKNKDYDLLSLFFPDTPKALSSAIRGIIVPREGNELIVSDYASIEVRVLFWLAGETEACKILEEGGDIYVETAKAIYEDNSVTKKDKDKRQLGKQAALGAGYGMGVRKFKDTCQSWDMDIDNALAKKAVTGYRDKYSKVRQLWYDLEEAAINAVENPGQVFRVNGKVAYRMKGNYLYCFLPSKRFIAYPFPKIQWVEKTYIDEEGEEHDMSGNSLTYMKQDGIHWVRTETYGGKACENAVQAIARDIMAVGALNCEKAGYNPLLMVHDELISEVPKGFGSIEEYERLLTDLPPWADGCPIKAADGMRLERYRKI